MDIIENIKLSLDEYWLIIAGYCIASIAMLILLTVDRVKRRHKYKTWKKDTLNLGFFKREWEVNSDKFVEELFNENHRLEEENKVLKRKYENMSWQALIYLMGMLFAFFFKQRRK